MQRKVILSKRASGKLDNLLLFLEVNWSKRVKEEFLRKLLRVFNTLKVFPQIGIKSQSKPEIYKCVVTKQTTIFYRYNSKRVEIITLFDTRQNPDKIKI